MDRIPNHQDNSSHGSEGTTSKVFRIDKAGSVQVLASASCHAQKSPQFHSDTIMINYSETQEPC